MRKIVNHLFFSYKSDDVFLVRRVTERLKAEGICVWMDEYGISNKDQERFQKKINDAIDSTLWGVLFVNNHYAESPYCLLEVERLLRKIPINNIIVLFLEKSDMFKMLYPKLYSNGFFVGYSDEEIFKYFVTRKVLKKLPKPIRPVIPSGIKSWRSKDAGFRFDNSNWAIDTRTRFYGLFAREKTLINNGYRTEYSEFISNINNREVRLLLDYDFYERQSESIMKRVKNSEVREMNYEEDDRERLKDEIKAFNKEVKNAYVRASRPESFFKGKLNIEEFTMPEYKHIGIHLFSTKDRGSEFKHRIFCFRVPSDKLIFRVYKLVLPHPQFPYPKYEIPIKIRFIFCFEEDLLAFYKSIPWCDYLISSFEWISTNPIDKMII